MDKLFIDLEHKFIGGVTTKKGFKEQIEKLKGLNKMEV